MRNRNSGFGWILYINVLGPLGGIGLAKSAALLWQVRREGAIPGYRFRGRLVKDAEGGAHRCEPQNPHSQTSLRLPTESLELLSPFSPEGNCYTLHGFWGLIPSCLGACSCLEAHGM